MSAAILVVGPRSSGRFVAGMGRKRETFSVALLQFCWALCLSRGSRGK